MKIRNSVYWGVVFEHFLYTHTDHKISDILTEDAAMYSRIATGARVLLFVVCWTCVTSDTLLSPQLTGTLAVADSPYVSAEDVTVPEGSSLTIETGVRLKFAPGKGLTVRGRLVARGEAGHDRRVTFTIWRDMANTTEPAPDTYNVKLVDGDRADKGM